MLSRMCITLVSSDFRDSSAFRRRAASMQTQVAGAPIPVSL
jgi:hypothetical protein